MRAQSPDSHINAALSLIKSLANVGWHLEYSFLTNAAAASACTASMSARQQPRNPAPLNRAPSTPGALRRIL